jgi:hypothetical protein
MSNFTFNRTLNARLAKRERLAVAGTAVGLTPASYTIDGDATGKRETKRASAAMIQVLTNSIYYTLDGTTPTSSIGFSAAVNDFIILDSQQQLQGFKALQNSGAAALEVLYLYGA